MLIAYLEHMGRNGHTFYSWLLNLACLTDEASSISWIKQTSGKIDFKNNHRRIYILPQASWVYCQNWESPELTCLCWRFPITFSKSSPQYIIPINFACLMYVGYKNAQHGTIQMILYAKFRICYFEQVFTY